MMCLFGRMYSVECDRIAKQHQPEEGTMKNLILAMTAMAFVACGGMAFADECTDQCDEKKDQCSFDCAADDEKCADTCHTRFVNCVQKCSHTGW